MNAISPPRNVFAVKHEFWLFSGMLSDATCFFPFMIGGSGMDVE